MPGPHPYRLQLGMLSLNPSGDQWHECIGLKLTVQGRAMIPERAALHSNEVVHVTSQLRPWGKEAVGQAMQLLSQACSDRGIVLIAAFLRDLPALVRSPSNLAHEGAQ